MLLPFCSGLLSPHLISKNLKIKIYKTIILTVLYECKTFSLTLRKEHRSRVFEKRVLGRIYGPKREKWWEVGEDCLMRNLITCTLRKI
jgi:hypothetical protein